MRFQFGILFLFLVLALFVGSALYRVLGIDRSVQATIGAERSRLKLKDLVPFQKTQFTAHDQDQVQIIQNTREVCDIALYKGSLFAATRGGLVQISSEGKTLRHFTVLDGLPESDLTRLAVFDGKLFIGTQTKGLVVFDGERFIGYNLTDRSAQAITSFLHDDGKLLIGTFNGGLVEFDGKTITEIKAASERILAVNCLRKDGPRLYVGTFNNGIYVYENDTWSHFTTVEGLPSNRVVGIEAFENSIYAATDFGLAVLENKRFRSIAAIPTLSAAVIQDGQLFLVKDAGEILKFNQGIKQVSSKTGLEHSRLVALADKLWLLSSGGISTIDGARLTPFGNSEGSIIDNNTSALAFDMDGNLWIGTFRHGIDELSSEGESIKHFETENIREINYLHSDSEEISVATSAGLIRFGRDGSQNSLTVNDGLPTNSVTHFSDAFIATAKGLIFLDGGRVRVLTAVQGLPNNSVYTTLKIGEKLYTGTLGGLAEIEGGRIVRTFKDSNSHLTTNWVTALCLSGDRLFIGTYGGGVFELSPSGEIRSFEPEIGKFTVNPNAMYTDGERLYAGSLTGLKILDLQTQEWKTVRNILPSETVMSITGDNKSVYFGTTTGIAKVAKGYFRGT